MPLSSGARVMAKILVVDDSQFICNVTKEYLEPAGHSVMAVQNAEGAFAAATQYKPDVVLLDVQLPDMSGFQVCQKMRESGHTFPILIMSASNAYSPWVHGLAQGFLFKPYTKTMLCAKVQAVLQGDGGPAVKAATNVACWDSPMVLLHHLRNSVGSVSQLIEVFNKKADDEFRTEFVGMVQRSVDNSMGFIEEYVELLRPSELKLEDVQINVWLNSAVASHPISKAPGISIVWQIDSGSLPVVSGEPLQLKRIADAVLNNALEAMGPVGTLTVGAYGDVSRRWVYVSFQDTGEGMENYICEHVLEPFFTMKKNKRGIGLSWAQKIARAHGGEIEVTSTSGAGACVLLKLPAKSKK
ncbi:MAG TPA: hypothetical protein DCZ01_10060 [Elusimicrobia bacterium]|nr:hypothetical protein [Elusimicrobiota bacterium]